MKKITPIIITVILVCYFLLYLIVPLSVFGEASSDIWISKLILLVLPAVGIGFIVAIIYTLITRLKEIDKEDKDDLSKY